MDTNTAATTDLIWAITDYTPTVTTNCINQWQYSYGYPVPLDRTAKAYEVAKMLMTKKLVECRTVKQFTDLMDELVKVL